MSIKPIDYNVILPKTQEISATKHIENVKHKNIVDSGFIEQDKIISKRQTKISDSEKSNKTSVTDDNQSKNKYQNNSKKRKKKKDDSNSKKGNVLGDKIDIHI